MSNEEVQGNIKDNDGCFPRFWFVFLFSWSLIFILFYDVYKANSIQNWTPIEAIVENVELKTWSSGSGGPNYYIKLEYQYQLAGKTYNGNRLAKNNFLRNQINNTKRNIFPIFKKLDHARKIQVYYNPKNPEESIVINQLTNSWYSFMWFVLFFNSLVYGLKLAVERNNKFYLLLPLIVLMLIVYQSLAKIQYVDTLANIIVTEEYSPTDCKFAIAPFEESVYIWVNNFRMENDHIQFNRNSNIQKMTILDTLNNDNIIFQSEAVVSYKNDGITQKIRFSIEYEILEECSFIYKNIELLD